KLKASISRLRKEPVFDAQPLKSVRENWVVPPGLSSFFPLFPALKRWAKLVRPPPGLDSRSLRSTGLPKNQFSRTHLRASDFEELAASLKRGALIPTPGFSAAFEGVP